jgi:hypothetical protein
VPRRIGVVQPTRNRVSAPVLPACVALGVVAGAPAKAADEPGSRWAADLGSHPVAWVLAVAVGPCNGRTRLWALVLLAPATWPAGRGLDVLAALLG